MRFKANSSIARIWASFHSAGTFVMYNKSNFSPAAGIVYHPYLKGRAGRFFGPCRHTSILWMNFPIIPLLAVIVLQEVITLFLHLYPPKSCKESWIVLRILSNTFLPFFTPILLLIIFQFSAYLIIHSPYPIHLYSILSQNHVQSWEHSPHRNCRILSPTHAIYSLYSSIRLIKHSLFP